MVRIGSIPNCLALCQKAHGNGYVGGVIEGKRIFAEVADGKIETAKFRLNGGWVGVLWEQGAHQAHFVRDHVGIETFYVAKHEGRLLFSTDLRILRRSGLPPDRR